MRLRFRSNFCLVDYRFGHALELDFTANFISAIRPSMDIFNEMLLTFLKMNSCFYLVYFPPQISNRKTFGLVEAYVHFLSIHSIIFSAKICSVKTCLQLKE